RANLPAALPVVLLNCLVEGDGFDAINIDNYGGALALTRHLIALGHRRIAFVGGAPDNYDARERLRGYRDALRTYGGGAPEIEVPGDFSEESGHRAAGAILALDPRPTAVFAANDSMAVGLLSALQEAGVRVPGDVAVGGFDDIPVARFLSPPLTTVRVGIAELGALAMERLLAAVEEGDAFERRREVRPATLVVRGSCGARTPSGGEISDGTAMNDLHPRRWVR
ncbi:MAG TPA: substrate-binding domain-containing protein, partial [Thermoanaerobaculia bacterium]|nr:substrate-binding domain-containing protein [Thermoanaerobaculia bacterium]